jgi:hypothetical protein
VFIVVCNNTATSKLVHDWIAGYEKTEKAPDGTERAVLVPGKLPLFSNVQDSGSGQRRIAERPVTILIDSEELESGDALSADFRKLAAPEIEAFKRDLRASGKHAEADACRSAWEKVPAGGGRDQDPRAARDALAAGARADAGGLPRPLPAGAGGLDRTLDGPGRRRALGFGRRLADDGYGALRPRRRAHPLRLRPRSVNLHLFRDCAATSVALEDPAHVGIAARLLGHRSPATTERHYNQASAVEAAARFQRALLELRGSGVAPPPRGSEEAA